MQKIFTSNSESHVNDKRQAVDCRRTEGPKESTLRFLMQFARSCQAIPATQASLSLVNIN